MKKTSRTYPIFSGYLCLLAALLVWQGSLLGQTLSVTPITWPTIGLDSNNVNAGPNTFPVGARVTNIGAATATDVKAAWFWDGFGNSNLPGGTPNAAGNSYGTGLVHLRPGTLIAHTANGISIAPGAYRDFYFEIEVTRNASAYNKFEQYYIQATASNASTTNGPKRQVGVEYLISQSRNSVQGIDYATTLGGLSASPTVPVGGTLNLTVGNTYYIKLFATTATNGYEQLTAWVNFPNTIFRIDQVTSTYTADTSPFVSSPSDRLYANGCNWDEDPTSPTYASCLGVGKAGGTITTIYKVTILAVPSSPYVNPQPLQSIIYDFSGSSFHYNADFSQTWYARITPAASFSKSFVDNPILAALGNNSRLTFTISNLTATAFTSWSFSDTFPGGVTVQSPPGVTNNGNCGTVTATAAAGASTVSFSGTTIPGNSTCTILVNVTAPAAGTYPNTSDYLYINGAQTNLTASDTLNVIGTNTCQTASPLVRWLVNTGDSNPGGAGSATGPGTSAGSVVTGSATVCGANATPGNCTPANVVTNTRNTTVFNSAADSWDVAAGWYTGAVSSATDITRGPYVEFQVNTSAYANSEIKISFFYNLFSPSGNDWPSAGNNTMAIFSSTDGTTFTHLLTQSGSAGGSFVRVPNATPGSTLSAAATGASTTYFRVTFGGGKSGARVLIDDVLVEASCTPPTISKTFVTNPVGVGGTSILRFTVTNPAARTISGISFSDALPSGLTVVTGGPTAFCGGNVSTTAPNLITFSGGSLAASGSCTVDVSTTASSPGPFNNVSTPFVKSTTTGANTNGACNAGIACATLNTVTPPILTKYFLPNPILTGGTSTLTFTLTNPTGTNMTSAAFSDTYPVPVVNAATPATSTTCGGTVTATAGAGTMSFAGGTIPANSSCKVTVDVTSATAGVYNNTSSVITASQGATSLTGNAATATLTVRAPVNSIAILKQIGPSATGPWTETLAVPSGTNVFFFFTVQNTGDTALTNFQVVDVDADGIPASITCTPAVGSTLSAGGTAGDTATCVSSAYNVTAAGSNTARATGNSGAVVSNNSTASYSVLPATPYNYGGLPVPNFPALVTNLQLYGGVRNATCTTFLGNPGVNAVESNTTGGPTSDPATFSSKVSWNGISPTTGVAWAIGTNGGSLDVIATCPAPPCFLNGWINWQQNGDFYGEGNQVFNNVAITASGTSTQTLRINIPASAVLTGTWYGRFRLTAAAVAYPSPVGTGLCGEVEDYSWSAPALTPITLAYFHAYGQGNRTRFEWSTASETGNIGFDIYAASRDGKSKKKLTAQPVRSAATDPTLPRDYSFDAAVDSNLEVFYIEDIDISNGRRLHGPFGFGKPYGRKPSPARTDWTAVKSERDRHQKEQDAAGKGAMASGLTPMRANLNVSADGLYRITYEALLAAGFNFGGASTKDLALTNRGKPVPIEVSPANGLFGPGYSIQFYGNGLKSLYSYNNIYTLSVDRTMAARFSQDLTAPNPIATAPTSYLETVKVDRPKNYDYLSPAGDPWYDTTMFTYTYRISADFPITLDNVSSTAGATMSVNYYGVTDWPESPDHHVVLQLNGATLKDELFDGHVNRTLEAALPSGLIREGTNTMTMVLPGDSGVAWDLVNLNSYSITYPRQFVARGGRLTFDGAGPVFRVDGLPSQNVLVYRISNRQAARLMGVQVERSAKGYAVRIPGSSQQSTYVVTSLETAMTPTLSVPGNPATLAFGLAKFLIISHPDFINNLGPLVAARQAEGLSVKVVDVRDIYDQYGYGMFDPAAIKSFIADAVAKMGTEFVLLVGGDTYDYRNDLGLGAVSFIPTLYTQTDALVTYAPVDPLYGDVDSDGVPDVAVGRFPVRTTAELDTLIRKTLAYNGSSRTAVFAADTADPDVSYKAVSQSFLASLPAGWSTQQANLDDGGVGVARTTLLNAMNSGVPLVNFVGHSAFSSWTFEGLFNSNDAVALTNGGRPLFVSQFGCWNTYAVSPYYDSLGHAFLLTGDQGAAGVMGGSTLTDVRSDKILGKYLIPSMATPGTRIGTAITKSKKAANAEKPGMKDVILGWVLLGDPTMILQR